jgi:hypothetical protein
MSEKTSTINYGGIGSLGTPIAAVFSYMKWHGFWLSVGHGFCGWFYVIYYLIKYGSPIKF